MKRQKPSLQNRFVSLFFFEVGQAGLKGSSCAADESFNRFGRNAQDLGNLGVAQSLVMPEDHGCFLVGRKDIERRADLGSALFFDEAFRGAERRVCHLRNVVYAGELPFTGALNAKEAIWRDRQRISCSPSQSRCISALMFQEWLEDLQGQVPELFVDGVDRAETQVLVLFIPLATAARRSLPGCAGRLQGTVFFPWMPQQFSSKNIGRLRKEVQGVLQACPVDIEKLREALPRLPDRREPHGGIGADEQTFARPLKFFQTVQG
jgi:hypothetical protein